MRVERSHREQARPEIFHRRAALWAGLIIAVLSLGACGGRTVVHRPPNEEPPVVVVDTTPEGKPPAPGHQDLPVKIPRGHFPAPGECRVWLPETPPGKQPKPGDCARIVRNVPPGAYLIYRSLDEPEVCELSIYHPSKPGLIIDIRWLDVETGSMLERSAR
jgi:hypothetical protein